MQFGSEKLKPTRMGEISVDGAETTGRVCCGQAWGVFAGVDQIQSNGVVELGSGVSMNLLSVCVLHTS